MHRKLRLRPLDSDVAFATAQESRAPNQLIGFLSSFGFLHKHLVDVIAPQGPTTMEFTSYHTSEAGTNEPLNIPLVDSFTLPTAGFAKSMELRHQYMETQAFHDLIQESSLYNGTSPSNASSEAGSPFPCQSSSENELSSVEAISTATFYDDERE